VNLRGKWVSFKIRDIYLPDSQQVLLELHGDDLRNGQVADLSDSGKVTGAYAVIEVDGLDQPVIVPVDRLFDVK
jgi:hypothetical protein